MSLIVSVDSQALFLAKLRTMIFAPFSGSTATIAIREESNVEINIGYRRKFRSDDA